MSPRPGVPSGKDAQSCNEPSPSKKIKTEVDDEKHDTERKPKEEVTRPRKRIPAQLRLGDFISTSINEHIQQSSPLENHGSPSSSTVSDGELRKGDVKYDRENDVTVLDRRKKQIDYGKNTPEYQAYTVAVPRTERESHHPKTPNQKRKYSRRAWDGLVRQWRLQLHFWSDPNELDLEKMRRKELHNASFSSETTTTSNTNSESSSQLDLDNTIKKKDTSWFEDVEDFNGDDDDEDDDNVEVTVK